MEGRIVTIFLALVVAFYWQIDLFAQSDKKIVDLLDQARYFNNTDQRVDFFTSKLLGKPFKWGPLGEGAKGEHDKDPLYTLEQFDWITFVETIMALSLSDDLPAFQLKMNEIRYLNGEVSFATRSHFLSADWIPNNINVGIIDDVTSIVLGQEAEMISTTIDKQKWFADQGVNISIVTAEVGISTIRMEDLLGKGGDLILAGLETGDIVNYVRHNPKLPLNMNISHQGIVVWVQGNLMHRHASFAKKYNKVVQTPFVEYLKSIKNLAGMIGVNINRLK